ncbi:flavin monoamine oxidase family protein [Roseococcus suduntuyensis]|uniref:Monoamine oxidase n=1 Tax=Roseococcus suduntuyensis TaxID=455361 RepID=A0A840AAC2_9PROT|nr:NAD(P)/FAD-dependent oxidoreductase [Roseococcus suduntuyensis]MBB3897453.1 monoamine oxidase [Roseococcus suduntuyensis]
MARTPLFGHLQRALALAAWARRPGAPSAEALLHHRLPRRALLGGGAALAIARPQPGLARSDRRVAIIGGGLAGLVVLDRLVTAGLSRVTLHEANTRLGGRIHSGPDLLGAGTVVELGGSFINSEHEDMLAMARRLGLALEDGEEGPAADLETTYFVQGARRGVAEIVAEAGGFMPALERLKSLPEAEQDAMSAAAMMDRAGITGWLRRLLDIGLTQEMGLEPELMSGLYFSHSFTPGPEMLRRGLFASDQRYQVAGGNDRVPAALARLHAGRIETGRRLVALRPAGQGYRAVFAGGGAVEAEMMVLALPLTMLRQVEITLDLPPLARRAIAETRYGTNAKLFAGTNARPWRAAGQSGECLNDLGYQTIWEDHARPGTGAGAMTIFAGGQAGLGFRTGRPEARARAAMASVDPALAGAGAGFNGRANRMHWPSNPYAGGSYTCFAPGQMTEFAEALAPRAGLYFAGEHMSEDHSGYMNGAAESGRLVAEAIQAALA